MTSPVENNVNVWLPTLLNDNWQDTVSELEGENVDIPQDATPVIAGAEDPVSGGSVKEQVRVKVYESGDQQHQPTSWGDGDEDRTLTVTIDMKAEGTDAVDLVRSARMVVTRILKNHRNQPDGDWDRITSFHSRQAEDFRDFQKVVFTVELKAFGRLLPAG